MISPAGRVTPARQGRMFARRLGALPRGLAGSISAGPPGLCRGGFLPFSSPPIRFKEGESEMTARTYESLASAAARMGVSVKTVRRRIANGVLPVYRCGRILRLDPNDVDGMFRRFPQLNDAARRTTGQRPGHRAN